VRLTRTCACLQLIFRSDSNGEDLEGFAGAGLYESVMATKAQERPVDYSEEPLFWDEAFRQTLIKKIADAAGERVQPLNSYHGPQSRILATSRVGEHRVDIYDFVESH